MKFFNSSLGGFNTKKLGLIIAFAFLIVEVVIIIRGVVDDNIIMPANVFLLLFLCFAVFSKEKIDDERLMAIRYFSFKKTMELFPLAVIVDYVRGGNIAPIYFAIGTLMGYLFIYYFCLFFNPDFIFKEKTNEKYSNLTLVLTALFFIGAAFYLIIKIFTM